MEVARTYRVPRSRLLGRQAQATTVYHYDDSGRLTHSVTTSEPEWLEDDYAWAVADLANQADLCSCGQPLSETTKPEAEGTYVASSVRCHACTPLERERQDFAEAPPGLLHGVHKS